MGADQDVVDLAGVRPATRHTNSGWQISYTGTDAGSRTAPRCSVSPRRSTPICSVPLISTTPVSCRSALTSSTLTCCVTWALSWTVDEFYHGTFFNEKRRVEYVLAHAALGGRDPPYSGVSLESYQGFWRYLADCGSLAEVDRWCDESVALLPPDGEPLACNRLLWLHFLRSRPDRVAGRPIAAPGELMTDGLVYTVLVAATAVRLLSIVVFQAGACRAILDVVWPLVADDPDLRAQRRYLDLIGAHALPDDPVGCRHRSRLPCSASQELPW